MNNSLLNKLFQLAAIIVTAVLSIIVYGHWGLRGSAALIMGWGAIYLGALFWVKRGQKKIRYIVSQMSEEEREAALRQLGETERAEVLEALKEE